MEIKDINKVSAVNTCMYIHVPHVALRLRDIICIVMCVLHSNIYLHIDYSSL